MNRRGFIRSLAVGGTAIVVAPSIAFGKDEEKISYGDYVVVQIFWKSEMNHFYRVNAKHLPPPVKPGELSYGINPNVYQNLFLSGAAEFLVFETSVFRDTVRPMLEEDGIKYKADY